MNEKAPDVLSQYNAQSMQIFLAYLNVYIVGGLYTDPNGTTGLSIILAPKSHEILYIPGNLRPTSSFTDFNNAEFSEGQNIVLIPNLRNS